MNITLTSLEALILKATNENLPCPDPAALEAFCAVMRDSTEGPQLAAQALAARVHASNTREALLTLSMLDRCMRRGEANFQSEVGKFRFLNEMIKLVSPKYFADRTAPEVRTRVLQLFHAWSIEYPKESKFKVAYDMLRNQGVIRETPPPLPPEDVPPRARVRSAIFEDEEKSKLLQKLLQSKKPEDLQHANRLIKTMVKEEERRSEASSRRAAETGAALDSAGLLRDMLAHAAHASHDERQLIHELHASCLRLRPVLQGLAAADTQGDSLEDILHASDVLDEVFAAYNAFVSDNKDETKATGVTKQQPANGDSLLDFASLDIGERNAVRNADARHIREKNAMEELGDIFATDSGAVAIAEPLKPLSLVTQDDAELLGDTRAERTEGWGELDSIGERLLRESLPTHTRRVDGFTSKSSKKIPMNALDKGLPKDGATKGNDALLDLDFFTKKPEVQVMESRPDQTDRPLLFTDDKCERDLERKEGVSHQPANTQPSQSNPLVQLDNQSQDIVSFKQKRPPSGYTMWLDSGAREQIKADNPGLRITEIGKKCGEIWRNMKPSEKQVWENRSAQAKEKYARDVEEYNRKEKACPGSSTNGSYNSSPTDTILDISMPGESTPAAVESHQRDTAAEWTEVQPLEDIEVSVSSARPSAAAPLRVAGGGVAATLHLCRDKPRRDVSVLVLSTANERPAPLDHYNFAAVVSKGCRVRLLPPSATSLPAHNPFAPAAITQVLLVGRPSPSTPVTLKFVLTYVCDDEMYSEKGEVKELPLL